MGRTLLRDMRDSSQGIAPTVVWKGCRRKDTHSRIARSLMVIWGIQDQIPDESLTKQKLDLGSFRFMPRSLGFSLGGGIYLVKVSIPFRKYET